MARKKDIDTTTESTTTEPAEKKPARRTKKTESAKTATSKAKKTPAKKATAPKKASSTTRKAGTKKTSTAKTASKSSSRSTTTSRSKSSTESTSKNDTGIDTGTDTGTDTVSTSKADSPAPKSRSTRRKASDTKASDTKASTKESTKAASSTAGANTTATATPVQSPPVDSQGRRWFKADMHLHTMGSSDYEESGVTYLDWMRKVAEQRLDIVAITDHNTVAGIGAMRREVEWLIRLESEGRLKKDESKLLEEWRTLTERTLILPGFEFTATFGFHILGIFPPETTVRQLEHILLSLNVPPEKLDEGSTETGASADVLTAYKVIHEAGGIAIAAHANSTHGVAMRDFPFGGQTKIAYTQDPMLDALEVTDLEKKRGRTTARFFNGTKTEYSRRMHCIQGSDAHRLTAKGKRLGIGDRCTDLLLKEPTFEALKELFRSTEFNRTRPARPQDQPFDPVEAAREEGPGIALTFHESASQRGGRLAAVLSDACALANTVGGTIYIGASYGKAKPKGLTSPDEVKQEIQDGLEERVTPPLSIQIETQQSQGANVLALTVPKGAERPYCLDEFKFYIRDETDTNQAVRDEIVALVREVIDAERKEQEQKSNNNRQSSSNSGGSSNGGRSRSRGGRGRGGRGRGGQDNRNQDNRNQDNRNQDNRNQDNRNQGNRNQDNRNQDNRNQGGRNQDNRSGSQRSNQNGQPQQNKQQNQHRNNAATPGKVDVNDTFYLPQIGVEIIESTDRKNPSHSIRDMRNGNVIKNVTRKGSRKLWNYAIQQHEDKTLDANKVDWNGDIGLVHVDRRAGKVRYDLALREKSGIRVFYGVTEDGMEGRWSVFIQDDEAE